MVIQPKETFVDKEIRESAESLAATLDQAIIDIEESRDSNIKKGVVSVEIQGTSYSIKTDQGTQDIAASWLAKHAAGILTFPLTWRTADNVNTQLTCFEDLKAICTGIENHVQEIFYNSWVDKDAVRACTTPEDIRTFLSLAEENNG